jgi:apolipoprotein D and lipocalin family protein
MCVNLVYDVMMRKNIYLLLISITSVFILSACANQPVYRQSSSPLTSVSAVDLNRYLGTWYEIYRLPNRFEGTDCVTVSAQYALKDDGNVSVLNTCLKKDGPKVANGIAKVVPGSNNSKLKVSFFRPFYGDYWVIDLAEDYSWVLVGEPAGKYFWILARQKQLDSKSEEALLAKAEKLGYQRKDLIKPSNSL